MCIRRSRSTAVNRLADALAKKTGAYVLLLSQLPRTIELRKDKHPIPDDINPDPYDDVYFLYRDAYYDREADLKKAELLVAKSSCLTTGKVPLIFDADELTFIDCK